jgi:hypothetical protein
MIRSDHFLKWRWGTSVDPLISYLSFIEQDDHYRISLTPDCNNRFFYNSGVTANPFTGPVKSPTAVAAPVERLMLYIFVVLPTLSNA